MAIMSCEFDEYLTIVSMVISSKTAREIIANDRENRHYLLNFHTAILSLYTTNMQYWIKSNHYGIAISIALNFLMHLFQLNLVGAVHTPT